MSGDNRDDAFERTLKAALDVEAEPRLVAARINAGVDRRRETGGLWLIFSPARIAFAGSLAVAIGVALGLALPLTGALDTDMLLAAAFSGGLT